MNLFDLPEYIEDTLLELSLFESLEYPNSGRSTGYALDLIRGLLYGLIVFAPWALVDIIFYTTVNGIVLDWNEGLRELTIQIPFSEEDSILWWKRSYNGKITNEHGENAEESSLIPLVLWLNEKGNTHE